MCYKDICHHGHILMRVLKAIYKEKEILDRSRKPFVVNEQLTSRIILYQLQYCSLIYSSHFIFNSKRYKFPLILSQKLKTVLSSTNSYWKLPTSQNTISMHSISFNEQIEECHHCIKKSCPM